MLRTAVGRPSSVWICVFRGRGTATQTIAVIRCIFRAPGSEKKFERR